MNQHYEFWVSYYEGMATESFSFPKKNDSLTQRRWEKTGAKIPMQEQSLCFQVGYPGLLAGVGYEHQSEQGDGQIACGFSLDYVTGLPYLPGSTVKGILRSAWLGCREYVGEIFCEETGRELTGEDIARLEELCFGTRHPYDSTGEVDETTRTGEDVFLDAWPIAPAGNGRLLGLDNITSHRAKEAKNDGLEEPNPVTLMKLLPEVVMQFRFILKDTQLSQTVCVTAKEKLKLYSALLSDLGAGAKTNVGFGVLHPCDSVKDAVYLTGCPEQSDARNEKSSEKKSVDRNSVEKKTVWDGRKNDSAVSAGQSPRVGDILDGEVTGDHNGLFFVKLNQYPQIKGAVHISKLGRGVRELARGERIRVEVLSIRRDGKLELSMIGVPQS